MCARFLPGCSASMSSAIAPFPPLPHSSSEGSIKPVNLATAAFLALAGFVVDAY